MDIQLIIDKAKIYLPSLNEERVRRAYAFAKKAHQGQTRFSGEPYITHPFEVANISLDFYSDEDMIIAALLHDVAEDTSFTLDDISKAFGLKVKDFCHGLVKLSKVRSRLNEPQIENLRKLFLAMARDCRVVLLKLCDRMHNMRTLCHVPTEKRTRIAQETLNIYAPIASRLGIYRLKSEMEDLCFEYLQPDAYRDIKNQLVKTEKYRDRYIDMAKKILTETFSKEGIQVHVEGRVKSIYSIYRKFKKKNKNSVHDIFDVFAMRIVLPDIYKYGKEYVGHLYTALGVLHSHFIPLANRFKDYIAVPKVNGYRSLHTTVMGLGPKIHAQPTEIQLRSESMHCAAEFGIVAHWMYEEEAVAFGKPSDSYNRSGSYEAARAAAVEPFFKKQQDWISGLGQMEKEMENNQELMENLQVDVFHDRIFVLTPRGDVKDLPKGATPVDFAYAVHTEIGNHCVGAKVNGTMVTLDRELKSGEVVEIVTRKNAKPSQQWLAFLKTRHAQNWIRAWFRTLDDEKHLRDGKILLNEKLLQFGKEPLDAGNTVLKNYNGKHLSVNERDEVVKEIGRGAMLASSVLRKLFSPEELLVNGPVARPSGNEASVPDAPDNGRKIIIGNQENVPHHFPKCCSAALDDELIGYTTRGRGVSIHRKHCSTLKTDDASRLIPVRVVKDGKGFVCYPVCVNVEVEDRVGLIRDITNVIADNEVNIGDISHSQVKNGRDNFLLTLHIESVDQLERVLSSLSKIPNVRRAFKANCGSN